MVTKGYDDPLAAFLKDLRAKARSQSIDFWPRKETRATLLSLEMTEETARARLGRLRERDYTSGPEFDNRGRPLDVWFFQTRIDGTTVYIKIGVLRDDSSAPFYCMSFKKSERSWSDG